MQEQIHIYRGTYKFIADRMNIRADIAKIAYWALDHDLHSKARALAVEYANWQEQKPTTALEHKLNQ